MKTQKLTKQELLDINGGSTSNGTSGLELKLSTDSLITLSSHIEHGSYSRDTQLTVLKGIHLDAIGHNTGTKS